MISGGSCAVVTPGKKSHIISVSFPPDSSYARQGGKKGILTLFFQGTFDRKVESMLKIKGSMWGVLPELSEISEHACPALSALLGCLGLARREPHSLELSYAHG